MSSLWAREPRCKEKKNPFGKREIFGNIKKWLYIPKNDICSQEAFSNRLSTLFTAFSVAFAASQAGRAGREVCISSRRPYFAAKNCGRKASSIAATLHPTHRMSSLIWPEKPKSISYQLQVGFNGSASADFTAHFHVIPFIMPLYFIVFLWCLYHGLCKLNTPWKSENRLANNRLGADSGR